MGGVGKLIKMGVEGGRSVKKDLKIGICGEHGGDPDSVVFCHDVGLNYVSCSPFRLPIARLAAAQAELRSKGSYRKGGKKKSKPAAGKKKAAKKKSKKVAKKKAAKKKAAKKKSSRKKGR